MNRSEFEAWEERIRARADQLWREADRPDAGVRAYLAQARELIAMEEVAIPTRDPEKAAEPVIEEASIQGNLGEFPTLTDQGEEQTYPHLEEEDEDDGPRLSDGDASEEGGVLPFEDLPESGFPDISQAEADVTSSSINAEDDPPNDDLNDDGLPDAEPVEGAVPPDDHEDSAPPR